MYSLPHLVYKLCHRMADMMRTCTDSAAWVVVVNNTVDTE